MARSEARILLIGSDLGQGLSSVAVCRSIGVQYVVCLACGRPGRRGLRIFMPVRMINEHDLIRRDYTDAWHHMRYVDVKN